MSFDPYLYFSFALVSIFLILEVTKNFKHSLLLKIQFVGLLTFASVVNLFLFKGPLTEFEFSIVRLLIDLMPIFVLNIALIIYAYKVPIWGFIAELSICVIGGIFVVFFTSTTPTNFVHTDTFHFYSIASTSNQYLRAFRILLLSGYFLFFILFIVKTTFFEQQKNQFFKPLRFWITFMILGFLLYIFENTLPIHVYTKGVYSTHVLPLYLMLGILYRPQSINAAWYQFDDLSSINKVEISKDNLVYGVGLGDIIPMLNEKLNSPTNAFIFGYNPQFNSHSDYLKFLLAGGIFNLFLFFGSIAYLFYISIIKSQNLFVCFLVIIFVNGLFECYLSRFWGALFYSFFISIFLNRSFIDESTK
jgi:hypothetical protein